MEFEPISKIYFRFFTLNPNFCNWLHTFLVSKYFKIPKTGVRVATIDFETLKVGLENQNIPMGIDFMTLKRVSEKFLKVEFSPRNCYTILYNLIGITMTHRSKRDPVWLINIKIQLSTSRAQLTLVRNEGCHLRRPLPTTYFSGGSTVQ